jgi:apolipoprotein N-acyltransferase
MRRLEKFIAEDGLSYNYTNSAILIEKDATVSQFYSKIHLAPIGEWFPYERWLPGLKNYLESMGASSFTPGREPFQFDVNGFKFPTLICYEGMFPRLCTHYTREGADFLVNITNDGWSNFYSGHISTTPLRFFVLWKTVFTMFVLEIPDIRLFWTSMDEKLKIDTSIRAGLS